MTAATDFEMQIARIESLLRESGQDVKWNDQILDPDNLDQTRQIDVTIRSDTSLTIVECRIHKQKQDVKWIEEIIGRRVSLKADAALAVSASGFTKGAILKAKAHGIILRDMISLTADEIRSWGSSTMASLELFYFENTKIIFNFPLDKLNEVNASDVAREVTSSAISLESIFDGLIANAREEIPELTPHRAKALFRAESVTINSVQALSIAVETNFRREITKFSSPSILAYDAPGKDALERNAYIEIVHGSGLEITQTSDRAHVTADMSGYYLPENAKLGRIQFQFNRPIEIQEFTILGFEKRGIVLTNFELGIEYI